MLIKSKSFLGSTFFLPAIFFGLVLIPVLQHLKLQNVPKEIGFIDGSQSNLYKLFNYQLMGEAEEKIFVREILPEEVESYRKKLGIQEKLHTKLDSVTEVYLRAKSERKELFLKNKKSEKEFERFKKLYDTVKFSRDQKDSLEIVSNQLEIDLEKELISTTKKIANSLLQTEELDAYIYLAPDVLHSGNVEYYSLNPGNLIEIDRIKQIVLNSIFEKRLTESKIKRIIQLKVLKPIHFNIFQLSEEEPLTNNNLSVFIAPIFAFLFLFISIFTMSGQIFQSIILEKQNRVLEPLISSSNHFSVYSGKILGIGLVGILQVSLWAAVFIGIYKLNLFELKDVNYLTRTNLIYFFIYHFLAYLLYALFFSGVGFLVRTNSNAKQIHRVFKIFLITPLLFTLVILKDPNLELVRLLSFFPFFTPAFMVMRIPISSFIPYHDIEFTLVLLFITITVFFVVSYRIFKTMATVYNRNITVLDVFKIIFSQRF